MAKRIGKSKVPLAHQLPIIAENLSKRFNVSVYVEMESVHYGPEIGGSRTSYQISFNTGFNEGVTLKRFKTWPELLGYYFKIMKKEV